MTTQKLFSDALDLLDDGSIDEGEEVLRTVVSRAERERDELLMASAMCRLGELLVLQERDTEARPYLQRVADIQRPDSALNFEVDRARELLGPTF